MLLYFVHNFVNKWLLDIYIYLIFLLLIVAKLIGRKINIFLQTQDKAKNILCLLLTQLISGRTHVFRS